MRVFTQLNIDTLSAEFGFFEGDGCRVAVYVPTGYSNHAALARATALVILKRALETLESTETVPTEWTPEAVLA